MSQAWKDRLRGRPAGDRLVDVTKAEEQQRRAEAAAGEAYAHWSGRASEYRELGHSFFVAQIPLGGSQAGFFQGSVAGGVDPAGILKAIEDQGWVLFDTGYVYMTTRNQSHILTDSTSVQGVIVGIYTFRRT